MLDVDDTEDRAQGRQEQARYDAYYGGYCFLPLPRYEGLSGRLITALFKAKRFTGAQRLAVLKRLVKRLRHAWPHTLLVREGTATLPEVRQWIEAQADLSYVTGLTSHAVLQAWARGWSPNEQWERWARSPRSTRRLQAGWSRSRRVVIKVAVSDQGVTTRFVVTDMEHARTQVVYRHLSCARDKWKTR